MKFVYILICLFIQPEKRYFKPCWDCHQPKCFWPSTFPLIFYNQRNCQRNLIHMFLIHSMSHNISVQDFWFPDLWKAFFIRSSGGLQVTGNNRDALDTARITQHAMGKTILRSLWFLQVVVSFWLYCLSMSTDVLVYQEDYFYLLRNSTPESQGLCQHPWDVWDRPSTAALFYGEIKKWISVVLMLKELVGKNGSQGYNPAFKL